MAEAGAPGAPVRGVVFDLDGTLVDSFPAIAASVDHVRAALGHPPLGLAAVRGMVGFGLERLLAQAFPAADRERARELYRAHHAGTALAATRPLPGAVATLARLRACGLVLGLATNKPSDFTAGLLAGLGLAPLLDAVVGPGDGVRLKPDPDMLERAVARLGLTADEVVYVGDMHVDVATAAAARVRFIGVATGAFDRRELEAAGAERVLDGLDQLPALLGFPGPGEAPGEPT